MREQSLSPNISFAPVHYTRDLYCSPEAVDKFERWYTAGLDSLPIPVECRYVDTCAGQTHVLITGDPSGPPLLLLHGVNNNALIWQPQWEALREFHVFALDLPGQPGRSDPRRPSLLTNKYSRWLSDVMDALDLPVVSIVGLSMGALIALRFAAHYPQRVDKIALLSPAGLGKLRPLVVARIVAANAPFRDFVAAMRDLMRYVFVTPGVESPVDTTHISEFLELTARYQKPIHTPRAIIENMVCGLPLSARTLRRVTSPCMVLTGADDVMFAADNVLHRASQYLPNLVHGDVIPGAGHAMIYEQPDQVNHALVEFLSPYP
jgi:pimeloyl-ACP methyl ester carboxylesterase